MDVGVMAHTLEQYPRMGRVERERRKVLLADELRCFLRAQAWPEAYLLRATDIDWRDFYVHVCDCAQQPLPDLFLKILARARYDLCGPYCTRRG